MTDPLIDRDELLLVVFRAMRSGDEGTPYPIADAVLDYLREVLTPEALQTDERRLIPDECVPVAALTGIDLHRRIFGEDR